MHSMVMRPNKTTQNPEQSKNKASTMPNKYKHKQTAAKITFVTNVRVPIRVKNDADPMVTSIRDPIAG